jgi:exosortase/archaeosortase family protein
MAVWSWLPPQRSPAPGDPVSFGNSGTDGSAPDRAKTALRVAAVFAMVVAAYHYSLLTLLRSLPLQTPLAYVGLAPIIAVLIAMLNVRVSKPEVPIYDRQVDYIIGLPLLAVALVVNTVFRAHLSTMFWVWRIDMFSLPFFVAGAVCTVFGVRTMWRQKLAIGFCSGVAVPYQVLLLRFNQFTNMTLAGVTAATKRSVANVRPGSTDRYLATRPNRSKSRRVGVLRCMVGFLMVSDLRRHRAWPRIRKLLWLAGGLTLLWVINVGRIMFIFFAGHAWGERVAIDVFHPYIGLVTFNMGIVVMLFVLRPIGLTIDGAVWGTPRDADATDATDVAGSGGRATRHGHLIAVPKVWKALALVASSVPRRDEPESAVVRSVGERTRRARLTAFTDYPAVPDGWSAELSDKYDWAKPYFGESSTWLRYSLFPGDSSAVTLQSNSAVIADVISTNNLRSFAAYGVEACYRFHGYKLRDVAKVDLGVHIDGCIAKVPPIKFVGT